MTVIIDFPVHKPNLDEYILVCVDGDGYFDVKVSDEDGEPMGDERAVFLLRQAIRTIEQRAWGDE